MQKNAAIIVSTYRQPAHLERCLAALACQDCRDFEVIVADDGSGEDTRRLIARWQQCLPVPLRHVWQPDDGFRKTRILNKAIAATEAPYLVFLDGDCLAHPGFVGEHLRNARKGRYLNGAMIRLGAALSDLIDVPSIESGKAHRVSWLLRKGRTFDRRYLRLGLPYRLRAWLNRHSPTELYWLGANSSCYRDDAVAVNGFDNTFGYGYEDGDFGNRLENYGLEAATVRWTANVLHLHHAQPWVDRDILEQNRQRMTSRSKGGRYWAEDGLREATGIPAGVTPAAAALGRDMQ